MGNLLILVTYFLGLGLSILYCIKIMFKEEKCLQFEDWLIIILISLVWFITWPFYAISWQITKRW
jgi:hypothetical protein